MITLIIFIEYYIFLSSNNIFIYIENHTHSPLRARSIPDFHMIQNYIDNFIYIDILYLC